MTIMFEIPVGRASKDPAVGYEREEGGVWKASHFVIIKNGCSFAWFIGF